MHPRILLDRDRRAGPPWARREFKDAVRGFAGQRLLLIARRGPSLAWDHPDLKEMDGSIGRGIVFAMGDPGTGAHPLHLARRDDRAIAQTVLVLQAAIE